MTYEGGEEAKTHYSQGQRIVTESIVKNERRTQSCANDRGDPMHLLVCGPAVHEHYVISIPLQGNGLERITHSQSVCTKRQGSSAANGIPASSHLLQT